jgi:hypothetical protein
MECILSEECILVSGYGGMRIEKDEGKERDRGCRGKEGEKGEGEKGKGGRLDG